MRYAYSYSYCYCYCNSDGYSHGYSYYYASPFAPPAPPSHTFFALSLPYLFPYSGQQQQAESSRSLLLCCEQPESTGRASRTHDLRGGPGKNTNTQNK